MCTRAHFGFMIFNGNNKAIECSALLNGKWPSYKMIMDRHTLYLCGVKQQTYVLDIFQPFDLHMNMQRVIFVIHHRTTCIFQRLPPYAIDTTVKTQTSPDRPILNSPFWEVVRLGSSNMVMRDHLGPK